MRLIDADALAEKKFQERECNGLGEGPAYRQGWNDAIDAVMDNEPSAQPEYRIDEWCTDCKEYDHERHCCPRFNHVIRTTLQEVKEEQVERKKGKWVFDYNNPYRRCKARCSICGKYSGIGGIRSNQLKPFCPNCGAEMTGGEQE